MKYYRLLPLVSFLAILSVAASPVFAIASAAPAFAPRVKVRDSTSTNWSGYAALTSLKNPSSGSVTDVKGTWKVPSVSCNGTNTYSSVWVGIDGYSDNTVEQTGTEQDCVSGRARYAAWYEMYPKFPVSIRMTVKAGDTIAAEVKYTGANQFTLTLTDQTTGQAFSTRQKAKARLQSAEWIVEAPSSSGGVLPLANFGTATISGASATIDGVTGPISDSHWVNDAITMANSSGQPKAIPSSLQSGGSSFSVTWKASS